MSLKSTTQVTGTEIELVNSSEHEEEGIVSSSGISKSRFFLVFITLSLVLSMNGLDINVLGDAAPAISVDLRTDHVAWLATVAFVTATCLVLPVGMMYAKLEPKYILAVSLVIFMVGEAVSGSARTFNILMVGRFFVGVAFSSTATAAFLITALICDNTQQRAIFLSLVTALYGVMIKVGPLVAGGFLKRSSSYWRWCFYIQLPIASMCLLLILVGFPALRQEDYLGRSKRTGYSFFRRGVSIILQLVFTLAVLLPCLVGGTSFAWNSGLLIACYAVIMPFVLAFAYWEYRSSESDRLLPLDGLRKDRRLALISIVTFSAILQTFAGTYYLPIYFQVVLGSTPIRAAVQLLPLVITGTIGCLVIGKALELTGYYAYCCVIGSCVQILGSGLFYSIDLHTTPTLIYVYQAIFGFGCGSLTAIGLTVALDGLEKPDFARVVAWMQFVLILAAAIGVGVQGAILSSQLQTAVKQILAVFPDLDPETLSFSSFLTYIKSASPGDKIVMIGRTNFVIAQQYASLMYVVSAALSLVASLCMSRVPLRKGN